jgi:hypothetical protein
LAASSRNAFTCVLVVALVAAAYLIPYLRLSTWWRFIPSTTFIVGTGAIVLGREALPFFGLRMSARSVMTTTVLFIIALIVSHYVLTIYVESYLEVVRVPTLRARVGQFFQVLNDELVLRAALLTLFVGALPRPGFVIVGLAAVFAGLHSVFYGLIGTTIELPALVSLFAFGVIGNTLFIAFGHIGYGLALHYAWNLYRFNARYRVNGRRLWEGETFNYIEGNPWVVAVSIAMMLMVFGVYLKCVRQSCSSRARLPTPPK